MRQHTESSFLFIHIPFRGKNYVKNSEIDMGRQGYKGISAVTQNIFVVNDDGDHVIKLLHLDVERSRCNIQVIAGMPGIEGELDSPVGTQAILSRPGR
jgi:hypothetical protein